MDFKYQISNVKCKNCISKLLVFIGYLILVFIFAQSMLSAFNFQLLTKPAFAQDFSTGVNPPIIQIEAEPPATITTPIIIENKSDQNITYNIYLRPFKAGFELNGIPNYDPELNSKYKEFFENVQIRAEDKDITQIKLSPRQTKQLDLQILVGSNEKPQDRYFTVIFISESGNAESETTFTETRAGIGTNVLLSIGPKTEADGRIARFETPLFLTNGPVPFELELANYSDYYVASEGNIIIKNMFGQIVGALEFGPLNILADSNRLVTNEIESEPKLWWNEKYPIGIYKAEVKVALSDRGPLLTEELTFVAFPIQLALILFIAIFIVIWLFKRARRKVSEET